jgi:DNA-binding transcriptional regulator GbsR (MarR family)
MHPSIHEFVEKIGLHMEAEGLPRSAGRIFGLLLLTDGAHSLDELAETLRVSKASVSVNARMLEQCGMLERTSEPGDRRDFYRMHPQAWTRMLEVARKRWDGLHALLLASHGSLPVEMDTARHRLSEAARFHALLLDEAETLIAKWVEGVDEAGGEGDSIPVARSEVGEKLSTDGLAAD